MKRDALTPEEAAYVYQFKPRGFHRTWQALYATKCRRQWTLGRWTWAALERENRMPELSVTRFPDGLFRGEIPGRFIGWTFSVPLGFGTFTVWGYHRERSHAST